MFTLFYNKNSIATVPDPDPAAIQAAIESHLGLSLDNPVTATQTLDDHGWAIIQWDPHWMNYRQIGSLRPVQLTGGA